jgi:hypothetical protein
MTWALVPVVLGWAVLLGVHTDRIECIDSLVASLEGVPIGVVSNPDVPAEIGHWHPATLLQQEPCAACLLSHQPGSIAPSAALTPFIAALWTLGAPVQQPCTPRVCTPTARAPPFAS